MRDHAAAVRKAIGAVFVVTALVLALTLTDGLQRAVPGYTTALQNRIESLLADASWDPAICGGGVSCEGRATIKL